MSDLGPFSKLLADASDYDLVNETDELIDSRYYFQHVCRFTPEEFVVKQVWRADFCIGQGGFGCLFHEQYDGDSDFQLTARAFKTVGLIACYEAIQEALALCGPIDPAGGIVHPQFMAATTSEQRHEVDHKYCKVTLNREVEKALAAYIRANTDKLRHLDDPSPLPP